MIQEVTYALKSFPQLHYHILLPNPYIILCFYALDNPRYVAIPLWEPDGKSHFLSVVGFTPRCFTSFFIYNSA